MTVIQQLAGHRILFLNWRDQSNPAAGGAESYTEQIATRFAQAGAQVTLFTSTYPGASRYDWDRGYLIIREGSRFGVYLAAGRHLRRYAEQYDAVVDFQNGIPFFAPLWLPAKVPIVCVVHHVHQGQFDMYFPWPLNRIGRLLEGRISRKVYDKRPLVAVSPSTRAEMRRELNLRNIVHIVPNGIDIPQHQPSSPRSPRPMIAVVTRLVPHKQLHHLVEAIPHSLGRWPDLRVEIAGSGLAQDALRGRVHQLDLDNTVTLPGKVSEETKRELLRQAWLTVAPSLAEGWGLTVIEANSLGTPAVAYNVPGLRDSIRHAATGWLVQPGETLATTLTEALHELGNPTSQQRMAEQARAWAAKFSWDSSAERLASVLLSEIKHRRLGCPGRRQAIDLATVASWRSDDSGELARHLRQTLRITDIISTDDTGIKVLLVGCDEVGAAKALRRAHVPPPTLCLATTASVLSGAREKGLLRTMKPMATNGL